MPDIELIMPKMGESIMEATILKWLKKEGDSVETDESILEIATDKVDSEVPSPGSGVVKKILFNEGDVVEVGKVLAIIGASGEVSEPAAPPAAEAAKTVQATVTAALQTVAAPVKEQVIASNGAGRFYSPLVLNIARQEGISMAELENLPGSGMNSRVTKKDILNYVSQRGQTPAPQPVAETITAPVPEARPTTAAPAAVSKPAAASGFNPAKYEGQNVEIVEMDRMRKLIADHMVHSKHTSAHVTSFVEADVTSLVLWREKAKKKFEEREKEKLTFTPLLIEAIIRAIKDFPGVNCSVDNNYIVYKKDINIGMAAALPTGNLIVPVIKKADQLNLIGLTRQVNDLAARARLGKLKPDEIEGGTFTLSNVGTFGNLMGTPVINQPQVAILATGVIKKKPVVIETQWGDTIAIRHMMFLSMSYDHRVVDGALGGSFIRRVADYLEAFDINREV